MPELLAHVAGLNPRSFGGRKAVSITLSAGVAENGAGEPGTVTLQRADTALYRAKAEGRNCVACA